MILSINVNTVTFTSCLKMLRSYAEKCIFDIFLDIYCQNYVDGDGTGAQSKLVHEICKRVLGLRQEYIVSRGGKTVDTSDKLYTKYIAIVARLPDYADLWYVTLCST